MASKSPPDTFLQVIEDPDGFGDGQDWRSWIEDECILILEYVVSLDPSVKVQIVQHTGGTNYKYLVAIRDDFMEKAFWLFPDA